MTSDDHAEGWYIDPYGLYEQRWFSAGKPSRLVRDGPVETNDPPPDRPIAGPLVPAPTVAARAGGSDLRRADEAESGDPNAFADAAFNAFGQVFPAS